MNDFGNGGHSRITQFVVSDLKPLAAMLNF